MVAAMGYRNSRGTGSNPTNSECVGAVRRMACGAIVAAGMVGALAMTTGLAEQDARSASGTVGIVLQNDEIPPPMQEPGQSGPDTSIHDSPGGPATPDPNQGAIYQDIMP